MTSAAAPPTGPPPRRRRSWLRIALLAIAIGVSLAMLIWWGVKGFNARDAAVAVAFIVMLGAIIGMILAMLPSREHPPSRAAARLHDTPPPSSP